MSSAGIVERMDVRPDSLYYWEHEARYQFARAHVQPGPLLDIASGTGYGSELLQHDCQGLVVGIDIDQPSLIAARRAYPSAELAFVAGSATEIPCPDNTFATVISMETIEHISDDQQFLSELTRVLRQGGVCILSTPNRAYSQRHSIANRYHVREYTESELAALLSRFFQTVQVFYQGFETSYHARVRVYAESIQIGKARLNPWLQWLIDHPYRRVRPLIPVSATNYFIRRMLNLSYPKPDTAQITIRADALEDCSNFVAICRKAASSSGHFTVYMERQGAGSRPESCGNCLRGVTRLLNG